jgi:hypothetical protein
MAPTGQLPPAVLLQSPYARRLGTLADVLRCYRGLPRTIFIP